MANKSNLDACCVCEDREVPLSSLFDGDGDLSVKLSVISGCDVSFYQIIMVEFFIYRFVFRFCPTKAKIKL
jgi:hypothetical protein